MIVVGYTADRFGQAALEHGIAEAKLRETTCSCHQLHARAIPTSTPRSHTSAEVHDVEARLAECGVPFELEQPVGVYAADALLERDGSRRGRAAGHRYPAPQPGRKVAARQCVPEADPGMPEAGAGGQADRDERVDSV